MCTMKLPRLLLLPLLLGCAFSSHSLSLSISLYFSLSLSLVNVVPFFFFISKNSLSVFVTVILDGIFSFAKRARVCAYSRVSFSLFASNASRAYVSRLDVTKKRTPQALILLRLSREEVNDKNRLWELQ